ncbi:maleylacetate reductase [Pseudomonas sp. NFACC23-1]|uniref:maleylacetate reductase n=1 Tax=unclassified Pseudomonas TaxID=196821 RepID=UPI000881CB38|nr:MULTISPECIES: maleylacetate reductase [unclassified Pseudomonas]SDB50781.1 maleylacetate reductase [Pseudomonas sp. NFACC17-2]SEI92620.1 maleylacetate reductase [Pseudomonas sp. NFACC23-1]SFW85108.1 maleylacetate reductase [Pseudomonas sp. NFACC16-2]
MQPFVYNALPSRVIFGAGTLAQAADELRAMGCSRALVLTTPQQRSAGEQLLEQLGDLAVGVYANATMHTPIDVTRDALATVERCRADCVIALGGGSTIGLGKAIALNTDLPQIVIPTTYAGSEATPIIGQTENGLKTTQRTLKVLPEVIIYDVELTLSLPAEMTVTSGLNAIAHAVEALYSKDANPLISMLAEQGIAAIACALPRIHLNPGDVEARSDALFGAWACGTCLGAVGMSIHHKLCHTLGGSFDLPHAQTHTVVLPHAVAYNAEAAPQAIARIARALGTENAAQGLFDLAKSLGVPTSLAQIGMKQSDVARATQIACASPYWNPRPIEPGAIGELLANAYAGNRP